MTVYHGFLYLSVPCQHSRAITYRQVNIYLFYTHDSALWVVYLSVPCQHSRAITYRQVNIYLFYTHDSSIIDFK